MSIAQAATRASLALVGGHTDSFPDADSAEVAAVYAVCDVQSNNTGSRMYQYTTDGKTLKVGKVNIPGQQDLLTFITFDVLHGTTGTWDGLQRR